MEYCYVLDYSSCSVYELELDDREEEHYDENIEEIFRDYDLNPDECSWMFSNDKLDIEKLKRRYKSC